MRTLAHSLAPVALTMMLGVSTAGCALVQDRTVGESIDETMSGNQIKALFLTNGGFSHFGEVNVDVAQRFVLLSGRTPSQTDKEKAEQLTRRVKSIDEVANEIVVGDRDIGRDATDELINTRVRAHLVANRKIHGFDFTVQVHNGVVYLLGIARSEEELRLAAEEASRIDKVVKVVSYVKTRDQGRPPVAQPPTPSTTPAAAAAPAPAPADTPKTSSRTYADPYAGGPLPPPKSASSSNQTAPKSSKELQSGAPVRITP